MKTPPHLRADRLWRPIGAAALVLGAVAAVLAMVVHRGPSPVQVGRGGLPGETGRLLVADARTDLPLQFADGSHLTFRSGSTGRMQRLGGDGAEVFLEKGRLEAHVIHAAATLWLVHAGPYRVRVTGTRFSVSWSSARLDVALFEGAVVIDGAVLGAGVPLRAGQRLIVDRGVVRTELLDATELPVATSAAAMAPPPAAAAPPAGAPVEPLAPAATSAHGAAPTGDAVTAKSRAGDDADWLTLAKQGAYVEAFSSAKRAGWTRLCRHLDAHRLLTLGDVARYAGARARARQAFEALVSRFPRDPLAADAVFSLGRLAFESDQSDRAARWFRRYVEDWPHGPLADQAVGRLVECAIHMHDIEAARAAARAYLARAPAGPHARLAHQILREGGGATASVSP
jgi:TolA-binding protein